MSTLTRASLAVALLAAALGLYLGRDSSDLPLVEPARTAAGPATSLSPPPTAPPLEQQTPQPEPTRTAQSAEQPITGIVTSQERRAILEPHYVRFTEYKRDCSQRKLMDRDGDGVYKLTTCPLVTVDNLPQYIKDASDEVLRDQIEQLNIDAALELGKRMASRGVADQCLDLHRKAALLANLSGPIDKALVNCFRGTDRQSAARRFELALTANALGHPAYDYDMVMRYARTLIEDHGLTHQEVRSVWQSATEAFDQMAVDRMTLLQEPLSGQMLNWRGQ